MRLIVSLIVRLYVSIPNCNRLLCDFRTGGALLAGKPPHNPRRCLFRGLLDWALDSRLGSNDLSRCLQRTASASRARSAVNDVGPAASPVARPLSAASAAARSERATRPQSRTSKSALGGKRG